MTSKKAQLKAIGETISHIRHTIQLLQVNIERLKEEHAKIKSS